MGYFLWCGRELWSSLIFFCYVKIAFLILSRNDLSFEIRYLLPLSFTETDWDRSRIGWILKTLIDQSKPNQRPIPPKHVRSVTCMISSRKTFRKNVDSAIKISLETWKHTELSFASLTRMTRCSRFDLLGSQSWYPRRRRMLSEIIIWSIPLFHS